MTLALGLARLGSALHRSPEHLVLRQSSAAAEFLHNQSPQPSQERPLPHPTGPPAKQGVSPTTTPALQGTGPFQPPGTNIECRSLMRLLEDLPLLLAGWNPTMSPTMIRPATREMKIALAHQSGHSRVKGGGRFRLQLETSLKQTCLCRGGG